MQIICQKKTREKYESESNGVYPLSNSQIPQIQKEKSYFEQTIFRSKIKKFQKIQKNSKISKKTQKCITKKIVDFS